jgi:hypothetical protein
MSVADVHGRRRNGRWGLAATLATAACFTVAPSAAIADPGLTVAPTMPTTAVGDAGVTGSLTLTNANTAPDTTATVNLITLVPSCGGLDANGACNVANPGVFDLSPTAQGAVGTACAGISFDVTPLGDAYGTVSFIPTGNVVLPATGSVCRIDYTAGVTNVPVDVDPAVDGGQTWQVAEARQQSNTGKVIWGLGKGPVTVHKTTPPPPPVTPPPPPPGVTPPTPPPSVGSTAPQVSGSSAGPGAAKISGPSGCVGTKFHVTVTGKHIRKVMFRLDRKVVKTLTRPNAGKAFRLPVVRSGRLGRGTHRVTATTTFTRASGTRARTLRVVFQVCSRSARAPQFTG